MANQEDPIGINEMILRIKKELLSTRDTTQPLFKIKQVDLEISFTVERDAGGGISFKVVDNIFVITGNRQILPIRILTAQNLSAPSDTSMCIPKTLRTKIIHH